MALKLGGDKDRLFCVLVQSGSSQSYVHSWIFIAGINTMAVCELQVIRMGMITIGSIQTIPIR
jgi:hypothetical protein